MLKEEAWGNGGEGDIRPLEAYNILLRRQISEDRVVVERTSIFLAASSFLFLAFVMLLNPTLDPIFNVLRILLPIAGIFLSFLLYCLNRAAINALDFWHAGQRKIEEEAPEFAYMRENEITPHIEGYECTWGKKEWMRDKDGKWSLEPVGKPRSWLRKPLLWAIYEVYLPLTFIILWLISLVVAVLN